MSTKMKYTAISRATRKSLISVVNEDDNYDNDRNLPDADYKKVKNQLKRARRMSNAVGSEHLYYYICKETKDFCI